MAPAGRAGASRSASGRRGGAAPQRPRGPPASPFKAEEGSDWPLGLPIAAGIASPRRAAGRRLAGAGAGGRAGAGRVSQSPLGPRWAL